ncbi:hypothetical protein [Aequorivita sp. CIP111184]|uniref:hypothetical protein n=1 Tax=Aequorivita sp. CIP111184 TaxID=2211356 RepID=UPI000DBBF0E3|nr:hypothetical protein [Aequorivita sp. CIP111184]SRX56128.1 hypothetical protein AEQU1_03155 [Aequorivita sp. CIP111184]
MIFIDSSFKNIDKAKKEHSKIVLKYLNIHRSKDTPISRFIIKNKEVLINGSPQEIYDLNLKFYAAIPNSTRRGFIDYLRICSLKPSKRTDAEQTKYLKYKSLNSKIEPIVNYDNWFTSSYKQYDYTLAKNLDRSTCTYCNRIYTNTMVSKEGRKLMRPQFDHWFPKSIFPLLALSFYNLIPSCSICNSTAKSNTIFLLNTHLHPYNSLDALNNFTFSYKQDKSTNTYRVEINFALGNSKSIKTYTDLNIKEIYNAHLSELSDLLEIKNSYSVNYIKSLMSAYPNANLSYEETYRLVFGTEYDIRDFHKRPFSKFKKDILAELKLIS